HLPDVRKKPASRNECWPETQRPSLDPRISEPGEAPRCFRDGTTLSKNRGALFYDGRHYCEACLDAAGGPGFAKSVRAEPRLTRTTRSSWIERGLIISWLVFIGFALLFNLVLHPEGPRHAPRREEDGPLTLLLTAVIFLGVPTWF